MGFPINQFIAAVLCCLGTFNCGMTLGWLSPAFPQLRTPPFPVGEVTVEHSSWLASLFPLATLIGTPITVWVSECYGRKLCVILAGVPFIINAILILVAKSVYVLMAGRFIAGFGAAMVLANCPTYIGEIADPSVRGMFGSFVALLYCIGLTASYLFGGFISYIFAGWVMLAVTLVSSILFIWMPETPVYLIQRGNDKAAISALAWLHRTEPTSLKIQSELEKIKLSFQKGKPSMFEAAKLLLFYRPLRYGFCVCLGIFMSQCLSGMIAVHSYSVSIFTEGGATKLSPEQATLIYGSIQILGAFSTTSLIEKLGRKVLLTSSLFGVAICMITMAVYFNLKIIGSNLDGVNVLPVIALSLCVYLYTIGVASVPFVLASDFLTNDVRTFGMMIIMQFYSMMMFILLKFFEPISVAYGRHVLFYFFGGCSLINGILTAILLTETKGKSTQEILDMSYNFKEKYNVTNIKSEKLNGEISTTTYRERF